MYLSLAGDFWFKKRFHSRFLVLEQHLFSLEIEFQRNFHLAGIPFHDLVLERTLDPDILTFSRHQPVGCLCLDTDGPQVHHQVTTVECKS